MILNLKESAMIYTKRQVDDALKTVRIKYFRSAGMAAITGMAGLYYLSTSSEGRDITVSAMLFCGFIVGFFLAGILLPQGFVAQLKKEAAKTSKP